MDTVAATASPPPDRMLDASRREACRLCRIRRSERTSRHCSPRHAWLAADVRLGRRRCARSGHPHHRARAAGLRGLGLSLGPQSGAVRGRRCRRRRGLWPRPLRHHRRLGRQPLCRRRRRRRSGSRSAARLGRPGRSHRRSSALDPHFQGALSAVPGACRLRPRPALLLSRLALHGVQVARHGLSLADAPGEAVRSRDPGAA